MNHRGAVVPVEKATYNITGRREEAPESASHTYGLQDPDPSRTHPPLSVPCTPAIDRGARREPSAREEGSVMATLSEAVTAPVGSSDWRQVWLDSYRCDMPTTVPYPRVPLTALLETAARRFPDRPACTLYGKPTTFAQLDEQAHRLARLAGRPRRQAGPPRRHAAAEHPGIPRRPPGDLADRGDGSCSSVRSWCRRKSATGWKPPAATSLSRSTCWRRPSSASLRPGAAGALVLTSLARRMAMWRGMLYRVERLRRNGYLRLPSDAHRHRFDQLIRAEPLGESVAVDPAEDVAVLAPTGGTTASPKAVMLTHRNLVANALQLRSLVPRRRRRGRHPRRAAVLPRLWPDACRC